MLHPIQIDTMHFRFKPRRNPGSQSQHRSVNRTAVKIHISHMGFCVNGPFAYDRGSPIIAILPIARKDCGAVEVRAGPGKAIRRILSRVNSLPEFVPVDGSDQGAIGQIRPVVRHDRALARPEFAYKLVGNGGLGEPGRRRNSGFNRWSAVPVLSTCADGQPSLVPAQEAGRGRPRPPARCTGRRPRRAPRRRHGPLAARYRRP